MRRPMLATRRTTKTDEGFTIMETLIVLAVAGLILLMVLQALPALQRGSRNNRRKQDVQVILEAVSHYELIDSGTFPSDCDSGHPCTSSAGGSAPNDYFLKDVANKLNFYTDASQITLSHLPASLTANAQTVTDADKVTIHNHMKCIAGGQGSQAGAGYYDVVALYATESSNNTAPQCQQL